MAQTITILDTDATEVDFSEIDNNEYFKYDDEIYLKLKSDISTSFSCIKIEDGAGANFNLTDKVKKYTSAQLKYIKTS